MTSPRRAPIPASGDPAESRILLLEQRMFALEERVRELESERAQSEPPPAVAAPSSGGEREAMLAALDEYKWNRSAAAEAMGMPRRTFYRRLKEYGIE